MAIQVSLPATARDQLKALRARRADAARAAIEEILARGCDAAGYRLSGAVVDHVCCRHLYGDDRLLTARRAKNHAVVLLVGPHSGKPSDVYAQLLAALDRETPAEERTKPPCCEQGEVPPVDEATVDQLLDAVGIGPATPPAALIRAGQRPHEVGVASATAREGSARCGSRKGDA